MTDEVFQMVSSNGIGRSQSQPWWHDITFKIDGLTEGHLYPSLQVDEHLTKETSCLRVRCQAYEGEYSAIFHDKSFQSARDFGDIYYPVFTHIQILQVKGLMTEYVIHVVR